MAILEAAWKKQSNLINYSGASVTARQASALIPDR
jgi:hypothetical protein